MRRRHPLGNSPSYPPIESGRVRSRTRAFAPLSLLLGEGPARTLERPRALRGPQGVADRLHYPESAATWLERRPASTAGAPCSPAPTRAAKASLGAVPLARRWCSSASSSTRRAGCSRVHAPSAAAQRAWDCAPQGSATLHFELRPPPPTTGVRLSLPSSTASRSSGVRYAAPGVSRTPDRPRCGTDVHPAALEPTVARPAALAGLAQGAAVSAAHAAGSPWSRFPRAARPPDTAAPDPSRSPTPSCGSPPRLPHRGDDIDGCGRPSPAPSGPSGRDPRTPCRPSSRPRSERNPYRSCDDSPLDERRLPARSPPPRLPASLPTTSAGSPPPLITALVTRLALSPERREFALILPPWGASPSATALRGSAISRV